MPKESEIMAHLTLRDLFVLAVVVGYADWGADPKLIAKEAYAVAREMLSEHIRWSTLSNIDGRG